MTPQHFDAVVIGAGFSGMYMLRPMSSDMFFPAADCQAEWRLIPDAEFRPIETIDGHLALLGADPNVLGQLDKHLNELLGTKG